MKKPATANGTPVYARQHKGGPTLPQLNAIDLLASGKTDTEAAELLKLSRTTLTKWRLYDPVFQAALNQRRAEVWSAGVDRLRSLIPKALDALSDVLDKRDDPGRIKAALEILRLVPLPEKAAQVGCTDAEEIIAGLVDARIAAKRAEREKGMSDTDQMLASMHSVSREEVEAYEQEARTEVLAELETALADAPEGDGETPDTAGP